MNEPNADTDETDPGLRDRLTQKLQYVEILGEYAEYRIGSVPRQYKLGIMAIAFLVLVASDPAAAQEFCDDPAGQLLINVETMLVNYGTMLLFLAFLIGVAMWALTPIFVGQSAMGLGMILLSFGAAIAFVVGTQFFGMTFEVAGATGQSCSTIID